MSKHSSSTNQFFDALEETKSQVPEPIRELTDLDAYLAALPSTEDWCFHEGDWYEEDNIGYAEFTDGMASYRVSISEGEGTGFEQLREAYSNEGIEKVREILRADRSLKAQHTVYLPEGGESEILEYGFEEVEGMPDGYFVNTEFVEENSVYR